MKTFKIILLILLFFSCYTSVSAKAKKDTCTSSKRKCVGAVDSLDFWVVKLNDAVRWYEYYFFEEDAVKRDSCKNRCDSIKSQIDTFIKVLVECSDSSVDVLQYRSAWRVQSWLLDNVLDNDDTSLQHNTFTEYYAQSGTFLQTHMRSHGTFFRKNHQPQWSLGVGAYANYFGVSGWYIPNCFNSLKTSNTFRKNHFAAGFDILKLTSTPVLEDILFFFNAGFKHYNWVLLPGIGYGNQGEISWKGTVLYCIPLQRSALCLGLSYAPFTGIGMSVSWGR